MKLIIHADDFGMTESINEAIIELCQTGTLSSTSIMANMPFSKESIKLTDIPNISLGLHSTFTQGKPLSKVETIPGLVDEMGRFLDYSSLIKKVKQGKIPTDQIFRELEQQYLWLYNIIGDKLVFIDSHHSIHNKLTPFSKAFVQLGKKYNIHAVRTRQLFYFSQGNNQIKLSAPNIFTIHKFGLRKVMVNYFYKKAAKSLSNVYNIASGMIVEDKPGVINVLKNLTSPSLNVSSKCFYYVVVHPATRFDDIENSNLNQERVDEYYFLKSPAFKTWVKEYPLMHFGQI